MKRLLILIFLLLGTTGFSCCAKGVESCPEAESTPKADEPAGEEASENMISSDLLSQEVYDVLRAEWDAWNAKSKEEKMFSSHMPGYCYAQFETWEECEAFLGFEVWNPLEDSEFEKGSYVGMPVGYNEAPRFYVSFYGTEDYKIDRIHVESGYRDGDVRITVNADVRLDVQEEGQLKEPAITEDSGEQYVATTALWMEGPITYSIRVIGEPIRQTQVRETLEKVLPYFSGNSDK